MPGLSLCAYIGISERTVIVTACFCQSEGLLEVISNAKVSMVSDWHNYESESKYLVIQICTSYQLFYVSNKN